ncbi:hypothetical protein [Parabacteroides goldsteinii]|uniref:hypothetical protein n=1 Tax=Parabacteroides goldsteinii TaxID=328812 RepID=UPI00256F0E32|nr:hypothetical protein [Parabacteroides goldsteinii]
MEVKSMTFLLYLLYCSKQIPAMIKTAQASKEVQITEWLIRYYPYNGIAMFGGKAEFTNHLHHRLLIFIRKRNYSFYLSKAELTVSFLLEVFGPTYYIDVLNTISNPTVRMVRLRMMGISVRNCTASSCSCPYYTNQP